MGKYTFYCREFRKTHEVLQPAKMFTRDPSLGFRDICLQIIKFLKEGKKIAIVDSNECKKTRLSYVKLLQKKCEHMSIAVVSILPKYGCEQLFWTREQRLASESAVFETRDGCTSEISVNDSRLTKWFSKDSDVEIKYMHGIVERPSESEGCTVIEKHTGIYTMSVYKFEVPVIFIQWEVICELEDDNRGMSKLSKALHLWADINICGRIIVVCDGSQVNTGEQTKIQQQANIDTSVSSLIKQFTRCPVYVYHVVDRKQAGSYIVPPKPGILAFLQQRHCLNLHSRRSVYIFESSCHMNMAENAGVRHIKASRVIDHPSLLISSHAAVTPSIPEMLKTQKILPVQSSDKLPSIPLVQLKDTFSEKKISQNLQHGRCEYMYAADFEMIERYNDSYIKSATKVGTPGSKMSPKKKCHSTPEKSNTSLISNLSTDQSRLNLASRDLPKWMMKKDRSQGSRSSEDNNQSECGKQKLEKIRKTMYVMTEKELVEVACDILKQGGKDEIVEKFLLKSNFENELCSDKQETTRKKSESSRHISECGKSKMTMEKTESLNDVGDQLGNVCPKMETESDLEFNELNTVLDKDIAINMSADDLDTLGTRECGSHIDETVASVLDDFSMSNVPSKPSPRKRTRIKEETDVRSSTPCKHRQLEIKKHISSDIDFKNKQNLYNIHKKGNHTYVSDIEVLSGEFMTKKRKSRQTPDLSHLDDIF
ncbi:uncharacterized protein LOC132736382 isoform X3 [Ruditapes philippinarum]|uniref:uncharacterized protein LOC132736382 isoform X2 n=1 Tax=Ruditapes philippinarum TaxID=129788 RepID=UPI00295B44D2|nr:uncharacterized protein LOC132736382 isoform X2 [Ruditapes philippinarum]XP_060579486.1 uncharacterized protein LOC132736382 isoform X3 [Ruditapes philippinarum]